MYIWAANPVPAYWPYAPPNAAHPPTSFCHGMPPSSPSTASNTSSNHSSAGSNPASGTGSPPNINVIPIIPHQQAVVPHQQQGILSPMPAASALMDRPPQIANEQLSKTNLYIRGLPATTSDDDLYNLCKQYGKIVSTKAIIDPATNLCKGYGFVDFDRYDSAHFAVQQLKQKGIQAQMAKQQEQDPTNLYISNLPRNVNEHELESMLAPYGQVISTRILRDNNGVSKGVGFARMESKEKCEVIIAKFNGKYLHNVTGGSQAAEPLLCKFADGGPKKNKHQSHKFIGGRVWREDNAIINFDSTNGIAPGGRLMVQSLPNHPAAYQVSPSAPAMWVQPPSYMVPPHIPAGGVFSPVDGNLHAVHPVPPMGGLAAQMNQLQIAPAQFSINNQVSQPQAVVAAAPANRVMAANPPQQQQPAQVASAANAENESNASSDPSQ